MTEILNINVSLINNIAFYFFPAKTNLPHFTGRLSKVRKFMYIFRSPFLACRKCKMWAFVIALCPTYAVEHHASHEQLVESSWHLIALIIGWSAFKIAQLRSLFVLKLKSLDQMSAMFKNCSPAKLLAWMWWHIVWRIIRG